MIDWLRGWAPPAVQRAVAVVLSAGMAAALGGACASAGMPPGGPPDISPPVVLSVTPLSMTTVASLKNLELKFDEVISETPRGVPDLRQLVFISPRTGEEEVSWHRDRLTIRPKGGWKPNTVYSVQISPGIEDVRNNGIDTSITVVFSTGGPIPNTRITGVVFDWAAGRGANKALVEAIATDSTTYQVLADTAGRFDLRFAPIGPYQMRAILDRNNNRELDRTEAFDTVHVTLTQQANVELYAFVHDTVGLRIADVQVPLADSLRVVRISFDKPLAPNVPVTRTQFSIRDADSTEVEVVLVQSVDAKATADSIRRKTREDSIAANTPRDTSAAALARADSLARKLRADSVAAADRAAREARRLAALRGGRPVAPPDTMPLPKMNRPKVSTDVFITLAVPLKYGTPYRVQANGVTSLSGTVKSTGRNFVTAREEKRDSTDGAPGAPGALGAPPRRPPP